MFERIINLNDSIKVKIYEDGLNVLKENYEKTLSLPNGKPSLLLCSYPWKPPKTDEDGYTEMQLHEFMQEFGPHIYMGMTKKLFDFNIKV